MVRQKQHRAASISRRLFNSLGTTIAPFFGALLILQTTATHTTLTEAEKLADAASVKLPYLGLAGALALLALAIGLSKLPTISTTEDTGSSLASFGRALAKRHLALGAIAIFMYVGAEVAIGSFLVKFMALHEIAGLADQNASKYLSYYWGGAMVGRFIGSAILQRQNQASFWASARRLQPCSSPCPW